ncbi:MotA/TolQ/ExbB proton channel family protein [Massilia sp. TS11]|uniref:MotA/TolQ/ExbB proton channel family protein n=1 Tax=Massilia sp. TS11 TaxID=2908003 RepID=UPI001EDA4BB1|nr:MotA/TolQ/ExbB proton channel family protein [Massilia sp. TS11]MCG2586379.1 MotA/TolQ/ExbB proton channel family protein [Massilia sp. TS11]
MLGQFSFARYWAQGDAVSHGVAWLLLAMSVLSWCLIFARALSAWQARRALPALEAFWAAPRFHDGLAALKGADPAGLFASLAEQAAALRSDGRSVAGELARGEQLTRVLRNAIGVSARKLESGLALLASIGATAPFIGLLGTVFGIYHALANVSAAGAVQLDKVAGPVGEALIMTGLGLAVAIPAVLAYNAFNRFNRVALAELDGFAHDLHAYFSK